ncbi:hypothetical protein [Streptosporangium sp. NPDC002524]|uniref:hypothetical protein n=1 Tax=Streptosporangium sp. NPDC002524 TaxID=3154537 RepID=UPI0033321EF9
MNRIVGADPIPTALARLNASTVLASALGGTGRVGAKHIPPYPRLRVRATPGGSDDLTTGVSRVWLRLEALDSVEAPVGEEQLRHILYVAVSELAELPKQPTPPGGVVINDVFSRVGGGPSPEADGRPRWASVVEIVCHA